MNKLASGNDWWRADTSLIERKILPTLHPVRLASPLECNAVVHPLFDSVHKNIQKGFHSWSWLSKRKLPILDPDLDSFLDFFEVPIFVSREKSPPLNRYAAFWNKPNVFFFGKRKSLQSSFCSVAWSLQNYILGSRISSISAGNKSMIETLTLLAGNEKRFWSSIWPAFQSFFLQLKRLRNWCLGIISWSSVALIAVVWVNNDVLNCIFDQSVNVTCRTKIAKAAITSKPWILPCSL